MKIKLVSLAMAMAFAVSAEAADNQLTAAEKADGWELLFDGKDINKNWRGYKMEDTPTKWEVELRELTAIRLL